MVSLSTKKPHTRSIVTSRIPHAWRIHDCLRYKNDLLDYVVLVSVPGRWTDSTVANAILLQQPYIQETKCTYIYYDRKILIWIFRRRTSTRPRHPPWNCRASLSLLFLLKFIAPANASVTPRWPVGLVWSNGFLAFKAQCCQFVGPPACQGTCITAADD
jgi:hypothetical protein